MIAAILAGILVTPTPSPTPSALPVIETVKVVTGSSESMHLLPIPASFLDSISIANTSVSTGDALLRGLPGFDRDRSNSMFTNYGQLRVSFTGAGTDRGLVLADGVPAQDGFGGQIDWAEYPSSDIVRAELLRGPGSALYGSGAIGGVLSLQTFGPTAATQPAAAGFVSLSGGTHAFADNYARVETALTSKLSLSASAQMVRLQYADLAPGYQTEHDNEAQAQDSMSSIRLRYAFTPQTVVEYGYRGAWDYQQEGRPNYDFWSRLAQNVLSIAHSSEHANISAGVYQRTAFVTNRADVFPSDPGTLLYTQYVPTHETGADADWIVENPGSTFEAVATEKFVGGVSDQYNRFNVETAGGSGTQNLGGLALQETLRGPQWEFVGGLRGDAIDLVDAQIQSKTLTVIPNRTDRAISPRGALRYDLTKQLAFRAAAGGGFRAPYLNELVRGYVIGPIQYLPNPYLVPERSSSLTSGFDWANGSSEISADYIHDYINDAIDFCTISKTVQQRCNFTQARTDGTTLVYTQQVGRCSRISLSGNQQYARITVGTPQEIGKQLPYVPKGSATLGYDSNVGAVQTGLDVDYLGMTWADDLNEQPLGTAVTVGAHASVPLSEGSSVALNISNLTNARYLSSIDRYGPPQVVSLAFVAPIGSHPPIACP